MSDTQGRYRIGVDVGGTFTDAAVFEDATGSLRYAIVPSTPADPARAVLDVLDRLGVDLGEVQRFIHGITIGTNAVLEGRGAEVWMLTTAGFRDVLEIARTNRTVLYDITALKPPPLVPRGRTLEIDERMAWDGSVLRPLDQARTAVDSLPPGVAVAVCFLHSYANPDHEQAVAALVREGTGGHGPRAGFVTASCEVLPEFREYERFNTTALNAYIGPLIDGYLARLQAAVAARGYRSPVFIMTSNGGVATAGPMHGAFIAEELEIERILVPTGPGNFAALGSLISDVKQDFVKTRTLLPRLLASFAKIADEFDRLEAEACRSLESEGVAPESFSSRRALGMRYLGQSWEIDVDVPPDMATVEELEAAFHDTHERRFGHRNDGETEVVSFRLTGIGRVSKPAVRAHWVDVGGMVPGSYSGLSTNIYQEGVRIPPIKILERGKVNRAAMALLMANMRVPEEREGDFNASLGACRVAERRIRRIYERYGKDTVHAAIRINLDRTERRLRERIAQLPDGSYCYEDYLEYYEEGRLDPVLVRIELTVDGDGIVADFAGSNPQVPGVVNSSLAVTGAGVFVAVKSILDPGGAVNDGAFRPIELRAPAASVVDVRSDAPAGAHGEVRKRAVSVALGALAQIIPERVSGDLCGTSFPNSIGGYNHRRGRQYVYYEAPAGGNGGFAGADGSSAFANVDFGSIRTIQTAESIENEMPLLVERCELRADSGGEGARRGGLGLHREIRVLGEEGSYSVLSDRAAIPPFGVGGGTSSRSYRVAVRRNGSENVFPTPGKVTGHPVRRGDVVVMESGGGGGYGDPLERDPEAVRADVREGFVSAERARDGYGVVLDAAGEVDEEATAAPREALGRGRFRVAVRADETDPYTGVRGRRRTLRLAAVNAERLGVADDDLVELLGAHPAPLRAWVRVEEGEADAGTLGLDAFGRRVLGVGEGDEVELRRIAQSRPPGGMAHPPA